MVWYETAVVCILAWIALAELHYTARMCYHGDDLYGRVARLEVLDRARLQEVRVVSS